LPHNLPSRVAREWTCANMKSLEQLPSRGISRTSPAL
jgi:hypothetical protein